MTDSPTTRLEAVMQVSATSPDDATALIIKLADLGFVLLPIEPTKDMLLAGQSEHDNCIDSDWASGPDGESHNSFTTIASDAPLKVYRAMLSAAFPDEVSDAA